MRVRRRRSTSRRRRRRRRRRPQSKQRIRGGNFPSSHQSSSSNRGGRGAETYQRHRTERRENRLRSSRQFFPRGPERRGRRGVENVVFLVVIVALFFDVVYRSIRRGRTHVAGLLCLCLCLPCAPCVVYFEGARGCTQVRANFQRRESFFFAKRDFLGFQKNSVGFFLLGDSLVRACVCVCKEYIKYAIKFK